MVYRTRSPGSKGALPVNAGFSDPHQRRPLLPGSRRTARLLPTGHPAQGARARGPSTGDPCPESCSPPRYARRRLTTTPLIRADLCLRSGSGARPDGTDLLASGIDCDVEEALPAINARGLNQLCHPHGLFLWFGLLAHATVRTSRKVDRPRAFSRPAMPWGERVGQPG